MREIKIKEFVDIDDQGQVIQDSSNEEGFNFILGCNPEKKSSIENKNAGY